MAEGFQSWATEQSKQIQETARILLKGTGFKVQSKGKRLKELGVTINIVAEDALGQPWYFDVIGAIVSNRPGFQRTDSVFKALGRASVLHNAGVAPLVMLTSHLPKPGSGGDLCLRKACNTYFDVLEMGSESTISRLKIYSQGQMRVHPLPGYLTPIEVYGSRLIVDPGLGDAHQALELQESDIALVRPARLSLTALPFHLRVYVPSKDKDGVLIPESKRDSVVKAITDLLHQVSGGSTSSDAVGQWTDLLSGIMLENVTLIDTYAPQAYQATFIRRLANMLLNDLNQSTAAFLYNNMMLHVEATNSG